MNSIFDSNSLRGIRILIIAPSLNIMGGQSVQADLLYQHLLAEKVDVGFLPHNPIPPGPLRLATRVKYLRTLVVSFFYVLSLLREVRKYDVIHIFSASYFSFILAPTPALLVAKLYKKAAILNYHSGEADDHLQRWAKWIFWILRKADKIVVPSQYLVEIFAKHGFESISIHNLSDLQAFEFRRRKKPYPNILVPRNLESLYDIDTSIIVFSVIKKTYPSATLTITGTGPEERRLKKLVLILALEDVHFTGRVERSQMPELFAHADIMLNTSLIDNMPLTIIEAFYAGLPIVTTDAGGIPYIVRHRENGMLIEKKNVEELAAAVSEVIENTELREKIVSGGRKEIEKYSWPAVRQEWANLYQSLKFGKS